LSTANMHREEIWCTRICVLANVLYRAKPQVPVSNGHWWIILGRTRSTEIVRAGESDQARSENCDRTIWVRVCFELSNQPHQTSEYIQQSMIQINKD
jgi:hypothetical protein